MLMRPTGQEHSEQQEHAILISPQHAEQQQQQQDSEAVAMDTAAVPVDDDVAEFAAVLNAEFAKREKEASLEIPLSEQLQNGGLEDSLQHPSLDMAVAAPAAAAAPSGGGVSGGNGFSVDNIFISERRMTSISEVMPIEVPENKAAPVLQAPAPVVEPEVDVILEDGEAVATAPVENEDTPQ
jgi:hypothetical protein